MSGMSGMSGANAARGMNGMPMQHECPMMSSGAAVSQTPSNGDADHDHDDSGHEPDGKSK
jgi:hypothetical protein